LPVSVKQRHSYVVLSLEKETENQYLWCLYSLSLQIDAERKIRDLKHHWKIEILNWPALNINTKLLIKDYNPSHWTRWTAVRPVNKLGQWWDCLVTGRAQQKNKRLVFGSNI
jgi:hypothetical protein